MSHLWFLICAFASVLDFFIDLHILLLLHFSRKFVCLFINVLHFSALRSLNLLDLRNQCGEPSPSSSCDSEESRNLSFKVVILLSRLCPSLKIDKSIYHPYLRVKRIVRRKMSNSDASGWVRLADDISIEHMSQVSLDEDSSKVLEDVDNYRDEKGAHPIEEVGTSDIVGEEDSLKERREKRREI